MIEAKGGSDMAEKIVIGARVPDFELTGNDGKVYTLDDFAGKKLVLYFYPKDNTPGCTNEALAFNANLEGIAKAGAVVVGVSRDTVKSHQKFAEKFGLEFLLLADPDEAACKAFDVLKEKNMYGKTVLGIVRSTFIIDEVGKLLQEFRKVKVESHIEDVLAALSE
jgi:peroxiredoxin Q/BCP